MGDTIGSIFKVAAPLAGSFLGGIGGGSREKSALQSASRSLVLNNQNPFFTSRFDPRTQSLSLAASPEVQALLQPQPRLSLPSVRPQIDFGEFSGVAAGFSRQADELVDDLEVIEEKLKNELKRLGVDAEQLSGLTSEQLMELLALVEPGFGRLTETVDEAFELARQRTADRQRAAAGDLRESLSRRRILGSRFAADDQSRQDAEFERAFAELRNQQAQARAQNFLAELDLSRQIVQQNFDNTFQVIQQGISNTLAEFQARFERVRLESGIRLDESQLRLDAFGEANRQALAFGTNEQQRLLAEQSANQSADSELFTRFQALGDSATSISSDLQSTFSSLNQTVQQLLAEAAKGRGAAFGTALDRFGRIDFGSGGSDTGVTGGSGTDVFTPVPTPFVPSGTAGSTAF